MQNLFRLQRYNIFRRCANFTHKKNGRRFATFPVFLFAMALNKRPSSVRRHKGTAFISYVQILRVKFGYLLFLLYLCAKIKYYGLCF